MMGATISPRRTQAVMASASTERLVRSRPVMVMKPAAPTSAAAMNTPSGHRESKPKIQLVELASGPEQQWIGNADRRVSGEHVLLGIPGIRKTGRWGTSAARRAEGWIAARTGLVLSGSMANSPVSKRHGKEPFHILEPPGRAGRA